MKKQAFLVIILLIVGLLYPFTAQADDGSDKLFETISSIIDEMDKGELEDYLNGVKDDGKSLNEKLTDIINGKLQYSAGSILENILNMFLGKVYALIPVFGSVLALSFFYAILNTLRPDFFSEGTGAILRFVIISAVILLIGIKTFETVGDAYAAIEKYSKQMQTVFPIILTLMIMSGGTISASVYRPAVAFLSNGIVGVIDKFCIPLISLLLLLSVVNALSDKIKLERFAQFFQSILKWVMGLSMTVFSLFLSVQGLTSATTDGIYLRATKYAISNTVPIVGGFLKEGFDLIMAGAILVKNAVGFCGVLLLIGVLLAPLVEILAFSLMLKLVAGVTEPLTDSKLSGMFASFSNGLNYLLACVLVVGFMYLITLLLLVCSSGLIF